MLANRDALEKQILAAVIAAGGKVSGDDIFVVVAKLKANGVDNELPFSIVKRALSHLVHEVHALELERTKLDNPEVALSFVEAPQGYSYSLCENGR